MTDQFVDANKIVPITPPPPHLLKKFSAQAQDEAKKRNGAGYLKTFATLCIEWAMNFQSTPNDHQIKSSNLQLPPELLQQWATEYWGNPGESIGNGEKYIATQAVQWGADQELEACCEWVGAISGKYGPRLRLARRPKPPSLKERALKILEEEPEADDMKELIVFDTAQVKIIRRALEAIDD